MGVSADLLSSGLGLGFESSLLMRVAVEPVVEAEPLDAIDEADELEAELKNPKPACECSRGRKLAGGPCV